MDTLEEDEYDELYDQLDRDHKGEVDEAAREFAANAIGDEHWDSDDVGWRSGARQTPLTRGATVAYYVGESGKPILAMAYSSRTW